MFERRGFGSGVGFGWPCQSTLKFRLAWPLYEIRITLKLEKSLIAERVGCAPKPCLVLRSFNVVEGEGGRREKTEEISTSKASVGTASIENPYLMYYIYLIKSLSFPDKIYIGNIVNINQRLDVHNSGGSVYTR